MNVADQSSAICVICVICGLHHSTHSTTTVHVRSTTTILFFLIVHHTFSRQDHACDRRSILQRNPRHFRRIDSASFLQVLKNISACVITNTSFALDDFLQYNRSFHACIL